MTNKLTKAARDEIRRLAEEAKKKFDCRACRYLPKEDCAFCAEFDEENLEAFRDATDPQTVLALIEQLEAWREAAEKLEHALALKGWTASSEIEPPAHEALDRARAMEGDG